MNQISETKSAATAVGTPESSEESNKFSYDKMVAEIGPKPNEKDPTFGGKYGDYIRARSEWNTKAADWQNRNGKVNIPNGNGNGNGQPAVATVAGTAHTVDRISDYAQASTISSSTNREVVRSEARPFNRDRAKARAEALQRRAFPQKNFNPPRVTEIHTGIHGDGRGALGKLTELYGKMDADLIICTNGVEGCVSSKDGIVFLKGEITNALGKLLGVRGRANNILSPKNFSNWGYQEKIEPLIAPFLAMIERAQETEKLQANPEEVRRLFLDAWKVLRQIDDEIKKYQCDLTNVVTSDFSDDSVETTEDYHEAYRQIFNQQKEEGKLNPSAGPFLPVYDLSEQYGSVYSHLRAKYPDLDGRSDEEKAFRMPPTPVIQKKTDDEFWAEILENYGYLHFLQWKEEGFTFQVPYFIGRGKIEITEKPLSKKVEGFSSEEISELAGLTAKEIEKRVKARLNPEVKPSENLWRRLEGMRRAMPKLKLEQEPVKKEVKPASSASDAAPAVVATSEKISHPSRKGSVVDWLFTKPKTADQPVSR